MTWTGRIKRRVGCSVASPCRLLLFAAVMTLTATVAGGADWYVVCERETGEVIIGQSSDGSRYRVLAGPFPGRRTAGLWIEDNHPNPRCDAPNSGAGDAWNAGELTSVTLNSGAAGPAQRSAAVMGAGAGAVAGPGGADLNPLIETATAAARSCAYSAALTSADHMANFDPAHPWLVANHDRLRQLASRQRATEQSVWQASSALQTGDLKLARRLAGAAADSAVGCQSRTVSELLHGIDTAIEQQQEERSAATRQAAAALLPGLIDLAQIIGGAQGATGSPRSQGTTSLATSTAISTVIGDSCAFKYTYRNVWNTEPVCTCAGYTFDPRQFRCVR